MQFSLERNVVWGTAFVTVFAFYAHTFLGVDSAAVTPAFAVIIAGGLGALSLLWLDSPLLRAPATPVRKLGSFIWWLSWLAFVGFGLAGFAARTPTVADLGLFLVQVGIPVLLIFNNSRVNLLQSLGFFCFVFSILDAVANFGALAGIWHLKEYGGRYTEYGIITRFPGLTGNSHAAGLVNFVAICWTSSRLRAPRRTFIWVAAAIIVASLFVSLILIDSRRYLYEALAAFLMLLFPLGRRIPLGLIAAGLGLWGLIYTFGHFDPENAQRADLIAIGWREAKEHFWTGSGIFYRSGPSETGLNALWNAYVTESGVVDLVKAYGVPATLLFVFSTTCALSAKRENLTWPPVMLAMLTGELAYGNPLDGFLGSTLFFAALIFVFCDEPGRGESHVPQRAAGDRADRAAAWGLGLGQ